eukprot:TRINITY_DN14452_c0_g1_i2.p1 TRINITY_DN14452_c0_g1~~TRINITY_DN14452_c0_g1_i2.p1  ORF type:complete len:904 (-),score=173.94 TRINITY_DN14452_c0_g1_i2:12-2723(-)
MDLPYLRATGLDLDAAATARQPRRPFILRRKCASDPNSSPHAVVGTPANLGSSSSSSSAARGKSGAAKSTADGAVPVTSVAVMETNSMSIVSKRSTAEAGYFEDRFLSHVACQTRRAPLIHRGYWVRAVAVDKVILWFLNTYGCSGKGGNCDLQILSLGAGFDPLFFRLADMGKLPKGLRFFEVDFAENLQRKQALIEARPEMKELAEGRGKAEGLEYILVPADLCDIPKLDAALLSASPVALDLTRPTLVLSEVVLAYLAAERADAVLDWVGRRLEKAIVTAYEQVVPEDGFGRVMLRHFVSLGSPILSVLSYPSVQEQASRHLHAGLSALHVLDMNELVECLSLEERRTMAAREPFDEFEEWLLKCGHYILVCSRTKRWQTDKGCIPELPPYDESVTLARQMSLAPTRSVDAHLQPVPEGPCWRFGQSACLLQEASGGVEGRRAGLAFLFGGTGAGAVTNGQKNSKQAGCHRRWPDAHLLDTKTLETIPLRCAELHPSGPMYAACVATKGSVLLLGGRGAPVKSKENVLPVSLVSITTGGDFGSVAHAETLTVDGLSPAARWRHAAVTLEDEPDCVLVYGGRSAETVFSDLWLLDLRTKRWIAVEADGAAPARHSHAALALPSRFSTEAGWDAVMLVSGGMGVDEEPLADAFVLEIPRGSRLSTSPKARWRQLSTSTESRLIPRFGHTAHVWQDHVLLVGGVCPPLAGAEAPLELWSLLQDVRRDASLEVNRVFLRGCSAAGDRPSEDSTRGEPFLAHNHCSVVVAEELLLFGGGGTCFSFGTHLNSQAMRVSLPSLLRAASEPAATVPSGKRVHSSCKTLKPEQVTAREKAETLLGDVLRQKISRGSSKAAAVVARALYAGPDGANLQAYIQEQGGLMDIVEKRFHADFRLDGTTIRRCQ